MSSKQVNYAVKAENGFNAINEALQNRNIIPRYTSYQDFYNTNKYLSHQNANKDIRRYAQDLANSINAGNIFTSQAVKIFGISPDEISSTGLATQGILQPTSYDVRSNNINNLNSKSDFLSNKMSKSIQDYFYDNAQPRSLHWKDPNWVKSRGTAMDKIIDASKLGFRPTYNSNLLRNDYFQYLKEKNPKIYRDWTRNAEHDLDGDGVKDIVLYDKDKNMRYFNGYGLNYKGVKDNLEGIPIERQQWLLTSPQDEGINAFRDYYHTLPGHQPKPEKKFEPIVNAFIEKLGNSVKNLSKYLTTPQKIKFQKSNYKGVVRSLIKKYVVLPVALFGMGKFKWEEISQIVKTVMVEASLETNQPKSNSKTLRRIWRNKDVIEAYDNETNVARVKQIVAIIETKILKQITGNASDVYNFIMSIANREDETVAEYFFNITEETLLDLAKKMETE